jgi:hypothetical protein
MVKSNLVEIRHRNTNLFEFSGDYDVPFAAGTEGVPFATETLITSNSAEMRVCPLPLEH